ncbi:CrcB family protein [Lactobacillus psittaci]|uniref:Fluoride-specific ion channel FluC n=1 Tax=Lactobacillus psittaci DSM 15354 TaxID=1122152 RepID=A0A0R1S5Z5_9LACO|nr:CrcB family protein [Lactobacillus psittaci]KRL63934.1 hypothetical protein FC23_GL000181 [Lactobacillus psittaci DSM 15354]
MILAGIGASIGAVIRLFLTRHIKSDKFPLATLIINLSGAFLLGLLFGLGLTKTSYLFLGTGLLGGYTTFSTLNKELVAEKNIHLKFAYGLSSYVLGFILVFIGFEIGKIVQ